MEEENKYRRELMGWVPRSDMPTRYSRRHIIEKSQDASLELQNSILNGKESR